MSNNCRCGNSFDLGSNSPNGWAQRPTLTKLCIQTAASCRSANFTSNSLIETSTPWDLKTIHVAPSFAEILYFFENLRRKTRVLVEEEKEAAGKRRRSNAESSLSGALLDSNSKLKVNGGHFQYKVFLPQIPHSKPNS